MAAETGYAPVDGLDMYYEIHGAGPPTLESAVEFFKLCGGGVMGDLSGMPASQLAVLPGTSHFVPPGSGILDRADWLLAMIPPFLDAPMPEEA
jgi:hypothetical protein